jgi:hypothetical protein
LRLADVPGRLAGIGGCERVAVSPVAHPDSLSLILIGAPPLDFVQGKSHFWFKRAVVVYLSRGNLVVAPIRPGGSTFVKKSFARGSERTVTTPK